MASNSTTNKKITLYTDGGSHGNPGPGGYGAVLMYNDTQKEYMGGYRLTTNNRMELMGVIVGLESLKEACEVTVYSDSKYVVDAINQGWVTRWQANNWKRNKKDKAQNVDLWKRLLDAMKRHTVEFKWLKGHAGHAGNERADELTNLAVAGKLAVDEAYETGEKQTQNAKQKKLF